jgi:phage tail tape-measure protein
MNHSNERNNLGENLEESGNNQTGSNANLGTSDTGETAGTLTDAVAGAMIGAPFGLFGAVIGGVSGGIIGNQLVETAEADTNTASSNSEESNKNNSINK